MHQPIRLTSMGYRAAKQTASATRSPVTANMTTLQRRALSFQSMSTTTRAEVNGQPIARIPLRTTILSSPSIKRTPASVTSICRLAPFRNASTTATASASTASAATAAPTLDWATFFRLRTSRRVYSLVASVITSLSFFSGTVTVISSTPLADTITSMSPIPDPLVTLGVFTVFTTGAGWLVGPFFGQALWRMMNKAQVPGFMAREKDFYERVKRYRVDPRGASAQNPVPDYYGEKVGSRDQWRIWLKDQRAFNRKREGKAASLSGDIGYKGRGFSQ